MELGHSEDGENESQFWECYVLAGKRKKKGYWEKFSVIISKNPSFFLKREDVLTKKVGLTRISGVPF